MSWISQLQVVVEHKTKKTVADHKSIDSPEKPFIHNRRRLPTLLRESPPVH